MIAGALAFIAAAAAVTGLTLLASSRTSSPTKRAGSRGERSIGLLARLGGRVSVPGIALADLQRSLAAAGSPVGLGPRDLLAAKAAAAFIGLALAVPLGSLAPGRLGVAIVLAGAPAGFLAPDLWLRRRARERARAVRRELPALLDLLRITVEAGASLAWALSEVGARASGPLAGEWRRVGREVALGVPLADALGAMRRRLPQSEVAALIAALDRARRHGAPISRTLAGQARDARVALRRHVQEQAAKAGPKIQLVVALLLVPSVLLMVAAALVMALVGAGDETLPRS